MNRRHVLGDPHLGRAFTTGVPLHRRGQREAMVWSAFQESLFAVGPGEEHVCMGDLFDRAVVPYTVVLRAAATYKAVARTNPGAAFVVLRGNHDASRDLEAASAFDLFAELMDGIMNVHVVADVPYVRGTSAFVGWHPTKDAATVVSEGLKPWAGMVREAFGHWDVDPRSGPHNLVPLAELHALGVREVWTGHDHKPRTMATFPGGPILTVTGSMMPYAHGEDSDANDDPVYVTLTQDQARERIGALNDKAVRIALKAGEAYELGDLDCLQLTFVPLGAGEEKADIAVRPEDFDLGALFDECMAGVPPGVRERVKARWTESIT